jgi:hypothetical protein
MLNAPQYHNYSHVNSQQLDVNESKAKKKAKLFF